MLKNFTIEEFPSWCSGNESDWEQMFKTHIQTIVSHYKGKVEAWDVVNEALNEDGTMARMPELLKVARKFDLKIISIKDLVAYRMSTERIIKAEYKTLKNSYNGLVKQNTDLTERGEKEAASIAELRG